MNNATQTVQIELSRPVRGFFRAPVSNGIVLRTSLVSANRWLLWQPRLW